MYMKNSEWGGVPSMQNVKVVAKLQSEYCKVKNSEFQWWESWLKMEMNWWTAAFEMATRHS